MISRFLRPAYLLSAAVISLAAGQSLSGQVTKNTWKGTVSSDYFDGANWSTGIVPGATSDILLESTTANKVLNINYTGTDPSTLYIYGIQTSASLGYTLNLSGNSADGTLIYNIVGRGTHPFNTDATGTSAGAKTDRKAFYMNVGPYVTITFANSDILAGGSTTSSTSGLTYAKLTVDSKSYIDGSGLSAGTLELGGLNLAKDSTVYSGIRGLTISNLCATGEEEVWAGSIIQDSNGSVDAVTGLASGNATQKWGTGTTRLTGTVIHPGSFVLREGGQYLVDGVHTGPITMTASKGSVLGGKGTINGYVDITKGNSLAPAGKNATGHLTINGTVVLRGALSFELFSDTLFDTLAINGKLDLATGATGSLTVGITDTFPLKPGRFRLMTFTSVDGTFASVSLPSSQGLRATLTPLDATSTYLDVIFTQIAYADSAELFRNHTVLAGAVDRAIVEEKLPGTLVDYMNRLSSVIFFRDILDQFSPTCFYGWYPAAVSRSNALSQTVNDRLDQRTERVKGTWDAWTMSYRQESSIDPNDWADYTNFDTMSVTGGVDTMIAPGLVVGGLMEYASTKSDLNQQFSTSETDSVTLGAYAQMSRGPVDAQVLVFAGNDDYTSQRNVEKTQAAKWAMGKTDGKRYGVNFSTSYTQKFDWFEISPNVGAQIMSWSADGFTETEASYASLVLKHQKETSVSARAGLRIAQSYLTTHGYIRPFFNVSYTREVGQETRLMNADVFGEGLTFRLPGIQKHGVRYDTGIDWDMTKAVSMQVRYSIEKGGAADESLGVRGGLNVAF